MSEKKQDDQFQIPIKTDDATQAGLYSNLARIAHNPETFQVDFMVVHSHPPFGRLQSRVILTPGHAKRFLRALKENIERYEKAYGEIRMADTPTPAPPAPDGYIQ